MGVCAAQEANEDPEISKARSLGITGGLFEALTLEAVDVDVLRAEIKRREKMPPMSITCFLPDDGDEREIIVKSWEELGTSMTRELGVPFGVTRLSFGNIDQELSLRWEDLGVEDGATVSAVIKRVTNRGPHPTMNVCALRRVM